MIHEDTEVLFYLLVYPFSLSICLGMIGCRWISLDSSKRKNSFMNLETNRGSRSHMILLGSPWSLNTLSQRTRATPSEVSSILVASRIILFVKRSTITRITSQLFESGRGPIKSQEIISQGRVGVSFG